MTWVLWFVAGIMVTNVLLFGSLFVVFILDERKRKK